MRSVMVPPPTLRESPCLMQFSTSGWRIMLGTSTSSAPRVDLLVHLELRPEADLLDVEVLVHGFDLVAQRHEVIGVAQPAPQQRRQAVHQHARRLGLGADERRDRRERVEEEMRVDLTRERLDLGGQQQLLLLDCSRCSMRALFQILIGIATERTVATSTRKKSHGEGASRKNSRFAWKRAPTACRMQLEGDRRERSARTASRPRSGAPCFQRQRGRP